MSEIPHISPLLDGMKLLEQFSDRGRSECCYLEKEETGEQFVLKHISIPESEVKTQALILTGAVADEAAANAYYETLSEELRSELDRLQSLREHGGIAACHGGGEHAKGEQKGKIEGAYNEGDAVGHFVDLGDQAGKAHETAEMGLRPCPAAEGTDGLVDLQKEGAHFAEVGLKRRAAQVLRQRLLHLAAMAQDAGFQFFQLLQTPGHGQGLPCPEKGALPLYQFMDVLLHTGSSCFKTPVSLFTLPSSLPV